MTISPPTLPLGRYDTVARAAAAQVISGYSTSFGWACRLLAEPVRTHVRSIYALVRVADELVDDPDPALSRHLRAELLDGLERDTNAALRSGRSSNLVVHAFALTARQCHIDAELTAPFFASMRRDLIPDNHTDASLARYIHGSAEVVGLMCLRAFVAGDDQAYERLRPGAQRLGAAFQKVNFLRDLAEDRDLLARAYFPGIDPAQLTDDQRDAICDDIDADLQVAADAIAELPLSSRRGVRAAHDLYARLNRRLRATPATRIRHERVRVPNAEKALIFAHGLLGGLR
ncbi:phytoene/squalene synthase family protein [Parenemella sanctibonifatiensis]|uniref:Phytoene synthase n=1 Tax=Parenemella sanctibonifatiensis TaxID=2016505 RepID=A0A255EIZ8_9ACTN|nr:squalene/phytoene synthase family protein [Parenemella sanctibonifatiensis]OYN91508.1 phytoene synthase [Parenemella sanctibonifatiensis]